MLTVSLVNARFFAFHGWHEEEQQCGNWFEMDIDVQLSNAIVEDSLDATLDYAVLFAFAKKRMAVPTRLLETIAEGLMSDITAVAADALITIVIRKENPPLGGQVQYSQIRLTNG